MSEFKQINDSIKQKLLSYSRKTIIENDLFLNEEHKLLCFYYNKYLELKSKLDTKNKKIILNFMKNILTDDENETLLSNEDDNKIDYTLTQYEYNIKYNIYNKKFINKLNFVFNYDYINIFLEKQHLFFSFFNYKRII